MNTLAIQQETLTASILALRPDLTAETITAIIGEVAASLTRKPREIKAVAKAADVLTNALAHGNNLTSAAIRPSRGSNPDRWVVNFTFTNWNTALTFARFWGEKIGLSFNVQRGARDQYSVSIPLIAAPANKVTVAARFGNTGAADAFAKALKGLTV